MCGGRGGQGTAGSGQIGANPNPNPNPALRCHLKGGEASLGHFLERPRAPGSCWGRWRRLLNALRSPQCGALAVVGRFVGAATAATATAGTADTAGTATAAVSVATAGTAGTAATTTTTTTVAGASATAPTPRATAVSSAP